jgi:hypothetical protein
MSESQLTNRTKSVGTTGKASGIAPSKLATLQEDDRSSNNEKEGSDSGGSGGSDRDDGGELLFHPGVEIRGADDRT